MAMTKPSAVSTMSQNNQEKAPATATTSTTRPNALRRRSSTAIEAYQVLKQRGVLRRTPAIMITSMIIGIACSAALHGYYSSLDGTLVGGASDQQRALIIGTGLALAAQVCLVYSIQKASVQWLWKELKSHTVSFRGFDAAFAATIDPLALASSFEIWKKVKIASTIAAVSWLIPLSTLFTPATLNVHSIMTSRTQGMKVPKLSISQAGSYERFAYAVNGTLPGSQNYLGPRTVITRLATASATTGEILTLPLPAVNSTYHQTFFGPYVQCSASSAWVREEMNDMIDRMNETLDESLVMKSLDYYAVIPALNDDNTSAEDVQIANSTDIDFALTSSNQLWVYTLSFETDDTFTVPRHPHYLTCGLYNASYTTRFSWQNGLQQIKVDELSILHPVVYPEDPSTSEESEDAMAYSSLMWALSNQLTGKIAFYQDQNKTDDATQQTYADRVYSKIDTPMAQTILIGSSDLNSHFKQNHMLGDDNDTAPFSDQRLQDMAYAGNKSLGVLIPELSSNITLSLIADPLLAPLVSTPVTIDYPANVYVYQSNNVLIVYCVAGAAAVIANAFGLYALYTSGVSHDLSFSSVVCSTQGVHFSNLEAHEKLGALPLDKRIADTRLRFYMRGDLEGWGFGVADDAI